ncbi:MAG: hypothetical protein WA633_05475 [Stellaceae bacterium]
MADLEKSQSSKPGTDEKLRRDIPGKGGQAGGAQGDLLKGRQPAGKSGGTVGRGKERHTEIAVEAGHKGGEPRDNTR